MGRDVISDSEREVLNRTSRTIAWKGRYPVPMYFDEAELQDPMIGYVAVSNIWGADEFTQLSTLYDKAKAALLRTAEDVPALPPDYNFR